MGVPQSMILEHMQVFAEEVMPAFEAVTASAVPVPADD